MGARNGEHGYGWVTRLLHWLTVVLLVAQVLVGYLAVDWDGAGEAREERLEQRADRLDDAGREAEAERLEERADRADEAPATTGVGGLADALESIPLHVVLGLALLVLVVVRVLWRRVAGLPPWDPSLTPGEQRAAHWTERALLAGLVAAPLSGVLLVAVDDGLVWLHVASHVWLYAAVAAHLALVLGRRLRGRPVLLPRMVRGSR